MSTSSARAPQAETPVPVVYWPRYPYLKWLMGGFMILSITVLWFLNRGGGRHDWVPLIYVLMLPFYMSGLVTNVRCVISGGVLSLFRITGTIRRIPLGVADVRRTMRGVQLRWTERKRARSAKSALPAALIDVLKQAALAAQSAPPGDRPATEAQAAQAVSFAFGFLAPANRKSHSMVILSLVALFFVAMWLNQPLILLPVAILPAVVERMPQGYLLMLSGEQLWVLRPTEAPHLIPLTAVRSVNHGAHTTLITTSDPGWPELRVNSYRSTELLKYLKRRMQGEPNPPARPATAQTAGAAAPKQPAEAAAATLRCSLCGRPLAGATLDGTVHICDMCSDRTRVDAARGGHGLTGKDPKPM